MTNRFLLATVMMAWLVGLACMDMAPGSSASAGNAVGAGADSAANGNQAAGSNETQSGVNGNQGPTRTGCPPVTVPTLTNQSVCTDAGLTVNWTAVSGHTYAADVTFQNPSSSNVTWTAATSVNQTAGSATFAVPFPASTKTTTPRTAWVRLEATDACSQTDLGTLSNGGIATITEIFSPGVIVSIETSYTPDPGCALDLEITATVLNSPTPAMNAQIEWKDQLSSPWNAFPASSCTTTGVETTCTLPATALLGLSSDDVYLRARAIGSNSCADPWVQDKITLAQAVFIPVDTWNGQGAFSEASTSGSGPFNHSNDGINNNWPVEAMCPAGPWPGVSGLDVGDTIYTHGSAWGSVPSCGGAKFTCLSQCGAPVFPTEFGQSWIGTTKVLNLTAATTVDFDVIANPVDPVHFEIFNLASFPEPGAPGDGSFVSDPSNDSVVSRQACSNRSDAFGCTGFGSDNRSPFSLAAGCYLVRLYTVDGTGGTVVTFDTSISEG